MKIGKKELARIETVIRQQWCEAGSPYTSWLQVDKDQALALIEMIPGRLPAHPKALPPER